MSIPVENINEKGPIPMNINYSFLNEYGVSHFTFPAKEELIHILHDHNFNKILSLIRDKIKFSNIQMKKKTFISEIFGNYELTLIEDVRAFLIRKGYFIQVISDNYHNTTGWVIDWS
jgi:hypothetical protein